MVAFNSTSPRPAWTVLQESISDAADSQTPSTTVDELAHDGSPSSPSRLEPSRSGQKLAHQLVVRRRHVQRNATPGSSSRRLDDLQRRRSIISLRPKPTPRKKTKTSDSEGSSESDLPFSPSSGIKSPSRSQKCHKTNDNGATSIVELSDSEEDRAPTKRRKIDSRPKNSAPAQRLGVIDLCSDGGSSPAPANKVLSEEVINLVSDDDQSDSFRLVEQELLGTGDNHAPSFSDTSFGAVDDLDLDDVPPLAEDVIPLALPATDAHDSAFPDLRPSHNLSSPSAKLPEDCDLLESTPSIQKATTHETECSSAYTKSLSINTAGVSSDAIALAHTSPLLPPTLPSQLQPAEDVSTVDDSQGAEPPKSPCQSPPSMGDQGRQLIQPQEDEGHSCTQPQASVIPGKVVDPDATLISIVSTKGLDQDLEDDDYLLSTFSLCYPVES